MLLSHPVVILSPAVSEPAPVPASLKRVAGIELELFPALFLIRWFFSRRVTQVSWWSWGPRTGPMPSTPPCADRDALTRSWRFVHTVKTNANDKLNFVWRTLHRSLSAANKMQSVILLLQHTSSLLHSFSTLLCAYCESWVVLRIECPHLRLFAVW